jgi:hypothetical protein
MFTPFGDQNSHNMAMAAVFHQYPYFAIPGPDMAYPAGAILPGALASVPVPVPMAPPYPGPIPGMQPLALPRDSPAGLQQTKSNTAPRAPPVSTHRSSMTLEMTVDPQRMPIKPLAKATQPPKWGVVKISNVSDRLIAPYMHRASFHWGRCGLHPFSAGLPSGSLMGCVDPIQCYKAGDHPIPWT